MTYSQELKRKVVSIYQRGSYSLRWLANFFSIGKSSICRWIHDQGNQNQKKPFRGKLTDGDTRKIQSYILANPLISLTELSTYIKNSLGKCLSRSTVSRTLRKMCLTRKKVRCISYAKKDNAVASFCSKMHQCQWSKVACLDEVGFQIKYHRQYGWSKCGQRCNHRTRGRRQSYHGIFLVMKDGRVRYQISDKAITIESFSAFIKSLDVPVYSGNDLVLDNLRVHHNKGVVSLLENKFNSIHWTPGYSPECNPIEIFFSGLKCFLRSKTVCTKKQLLLNIEEYITTRPSNFYHRLYQHCW